MEQAIKDLFLDFLKAVFLGFFEWLWDVIQAGWGLIMAFFGRTLYVGYWDGVWLTFQDFLSTLFVEFFTEYIRRMVLSGWDLLKAIFSNLTRLYKE